MSNVTVLIEGYAKELKNGWKATSTTTLIEDSDKKILVDPGINKELLLKKLDGQGLKPDDIDIVFLSHYHLDHMFLAALFDHATIMDGSTIYEKDKETEFEGKIPGTDVMVILTPGHANEHASLIVDTLEGKVVIAADIFWWTNKQVQKTDNFEELLNREDPFTVDWDALKRSRRKILKIADWIIPGHGKMFKNPRRKLND